MIKYFSKTNDSLRTALKKIGDSAQKCIVVLNKHHQLIGTISDGDIRKALLKKMKLSSSIENIYNKKPKYLEINKYSRTDVKKIFSKFNLGIIPVVDHNNNIKFNLDRNIFFNEKKIKEKINVPVIIMAGGMGTRLLPLTNILPKPLIPFKEKPIIEHIFDRFSEQGFNKFYISINFKSKVIKTYFREIKNNKYKISLIREKEPLGTASSLQLLKNKINSDCFVTNCDVLFNTDYSNLLSFHKKNKNLITLVGSNKLISIPYGVCKLNEKKNLKKLDEKPDLNIIVNTGLYVISTKVLKFIPKQKKYDFDRLISDVLKKKLKIGVYPINDKSWIDVGQWSGFQKEVDF